jgi:DNA replication protein DnaC
MIQQEILNILKDCAMPLRFLNKIKQNIKYVEIDNQYTEYIDYLKESFQDFTTFEIVAKYLKNLVVQNKPEGLFIISENSGVGKSHLLNVSAQILIETLLALEKSKIAVKIIDAQNFKDLWTSKNYNFNDTEIKTVLKTKYLFIDNFGKDGYTSEQGKDFINKFWLRVYQYRLDASLPTFIASSLYGKDAVKTLYSADLSSVLKELCPNIINLHGEEMRESEILN